MEHCGHKPYSKWTQVEIQLRYEFKEATWPVILGLLNNQAPQNYRTILTEGENNC